MTIEIERNGQRSHVTALITGQPAGLAWLENEFGIGIWDLDADIAHQFDLPRDRGVLVIRVVADLGAEGAGIRVGDIITSINKREITSVSQFLAELNRTDISKGVLLGVLDPRGSQRLVVLSP